MTSQRADFPELCVKIHIKNQAKETKGDATSLVPISKEFADRLETHHNEELTWLFWGFFFHIFEHNEAFKSN